MGQRFPPPTSITDTESFKTTWGNSGATPQTSCKISSWKWSLWVTHLLQWTLLARTPVASHLHPRPVNLCSLACSTLFPTCDLIKNTNFQIINNLAHLWNGSCPLKMTFNKRNWRILFRISLTESNMTLKVYLWVYNCVLVISWTCQTWHFYSYPPGRLPSWMTNLSSSWDLYGRTASSISSLFLSLPVTSLNTSVAGADVSFNSSSYSRVSSVPSVNATNHVCTVQHFPPLTTLREGIYLIVLMYVSDYHLYNSFSQFHGVLASSFEILVYFLALGYCPCEW